MGLYFWSPGKRELHFGHLELVKTIMKLEKTFFLCGNGSQVAVVVTSSKNVCEWWSHHHGKRWSTETADSQKAVPFHSSVHRTIAPSQKYGVLQTIPDMHASDQVFSLTDLVPCCGEYSLIEKQLYCPCNGTRNGFMLQRSHVMRGRVMTGCYVLRFGGTELGPHTGCALYWLDNLVQTT